MDYIARPIERGENSFIGAKKKLIDKLRSSPRLPWVETEPGRHSREGGEVGERAVRAIITRDDSAVTGVTAATAT